MACMAWKLVGEWASGRVGEYILAMADFTRRGFLTGVAGGAAAISIASFLPAGCERTYPHASSDNADLKSLSPKEYAVARAAAEALLVGVPVSATTVAKR